MTEDARPAGVDPVAGAAAGEPAASAASHQEASAQTADDPQPAGRLARFAKLARLGKGGVGRHVATLGLGTGAVMAIQLGSQFFVGKMLSEGDFGAYRNVTSLATILALAVTLGLERAISLAADEDEARDVTRLAIALSAVASLALIPVLVLLAMTPVGADPAYRWAMVVAPVLLLSSAAFNVFRAYLPRRDLFRSVSDSNIAGTTLMGGTQIVSAFFRFADGLTLGYTGGRLLSSVMMWRSCGLPWRGRVRWGLLRKWSGFPLWVMVPAVLNAVTVGGVGPLVSSFYGTDFNGQFGFTQQFLAAPVALLGGAVASVFYVRFAAMDRGGDDTSRVILRLASILLAVGVAIFVPMTLLGRELFVWMPFWEGKWETAGIITGLMAPSLLMQFASSPLSGYATVRNELKRNFVVSVIEASVRVPALAVGLLIGGPLYGVQAYCWAGLAIFLYWVIHVLRLSGVPTAPAWRTVSLPLAASTLAWAMTTFGRGPLGETTYVLVSLVACVAAMAYGGRAALKALRG